MWDVGARRPIITLLAVLATTALLGAGIPRIDAQVDFVDTVPAHPGLEPYQEMVARLDGIRFVAIYMAHDPGHPSTDLRSEDGFDALVLQQGAMQAFLEQRFPGMFSHMLSVHEGMKAGNYMLEKLATGGNARPESYNVPEDQARYDTVRDRGLEDGSFDDVLAKDGSSALLLAFFETQDNRAARASSGDVAEALADFGGNGVTRDHQASGLLYSSHVTDERNREDVVLWGGIALAAVAIVLVGLLRRVDDVLVALTSVALATTWTFGALGWLGIELSFLSMFLAPAVIGVGIDQAVHVLHRVKEERTAGAAMRAIGRPVAVAGMTTAVGLAALLWVPAPLFSEIGGVSALGIFFSLITALTFVPAAAALGRARRPPPRDGVGRVLARWARHARRSAWPLALVGVLTVGAVVIAATETRVEAGSAENEFPQDDPVIQLQHRIEEEYGAFQRAYLIFRGDMTDPTALQALHAASIRVMDVPLYRNASSVADLLLADAATDEGAIDILRDAVLGATQQSPSDAQRLPQTRSEAEAALDAVFADPLWGSIAPFTITRDYDLAVVALELEPWQDQSELQALRDALLQVQDAVQADLPSHEVRAGGAPINRAAIVEQTPLDISIATIGTALSVGLVLVVAWSRRGWDGLRVAVIGLSLVLVAAVWLLAAVPLLDGWYHVTGSGNNAALNDMFLLAFAITVAVGIDDLVHIASRFWEARDRGTSTDGALDEAFHHAGRAITGTTLTTFMAFAVLAGTYFLQSKNLAILTATGVLATYLLTLAVLPRALAGRATRQD